MKDMPPEGYTGEWIVRVPGIKNPEQARVVWDKLHAAVEALDMPGAAAIFDQSRWDGGDF